MSGHRFLDRAHAGRELAKQLKAWKDNPETFVLALPRGGVPVAAEVAHALNAPLDVVVVRKLGFPTHPETAMGALAAAAGTTQMVRNSNVMAQLDKLEHGRETFRKTLERERIELGRRDKEYRGSRPPIRVTACTIILVDDGLATGATMRAAVVVLTALHPQRIVVAVPVGSPQAVAQLQSLTDQIVCLWQPDDFRAVGQAYKHFDQTSDEEVRSTLERYPATGSRKWG